MKQRRPISSFRRDTARRCSDQHQRCAGSGSRRAVRFARFRDFEVQTWTHACRGRSPHPGALRAPTLPLQGRV